MKKIFTWIALLCLVVADVRGEEMKDAEPYFFSTVARKGDGIQIILKRYNLLDFSCNLAKFCELNGISKDDYLHAEKEYILPIKIYRYNGQSIRSTIGDQDYSKAVRIQKYNEFLLREGLRST